MLRCSVALTVLFLVAPVSAFETEWQEVMPDVRLRLVVATVLAAPEKTLAGLQVEMPDNYKSYWRIPGESGIAPQIDWSASAGVKSARFRFPLPVVEDQAGYTDYVYHGSVLLPLELELDGSVTIDASLFMGICSDICIPVTARFQLPLDADQNRDTHVADISQALTRVPGEWEFPDPAIASVTYQEEGNGLLIRTNYDGVELTSIITSVSDESVFFGPAKEVAEVGAAFVPLLGGSTYAELPDSMVTLSFMSDMGPYEVSVPVATE